MAQDIRHSHIVRDGKAVPGCDGCTLNVSWIRIITIRDITQEEYDMATRFYLDRDQRSLDALRESIEEANA